MISITIRYCCRYGSRINSLCSVEILQFDYMLINCKIDCLVLWRIIELSRNIIGGDFKCVEYIFLPLQQGRSRFLNCKTEDRISKAKILW